MLRELDTLESERAAACSVADTKEVSVYFYGSVAELDRRDRIGSLYYDDPDVKALGSKVSSCMLSRADQYDRAILLSRRLLELRSKHALTDADFSLMKELAFEETPMLVHDCVYVTALQSQCSPTQRHLLEDALAWKTLGCFAQTELGHGSSVRDIETEANYDPNSDGFVLHTPCVSAVKWWVGGLGKTATHAVVVAQLILDGQSHGPHAFHVKLRDERHALLPGIKTGDIGPKLGYTPVDNGFLELDHVWVPRSCMLSGAASVQRVGAGADAKGVYKPPTHPQAGYRGMLLARCLIVQFSRVALTHATTIAVRYSIVRRQFRNEDGKEMKILDYPSQQIRLLPVLAATFVMNALAEHLQATLESVDVQFQHDNFTALSRLHALSAALKVFVTEQVTDGIEACRRCCGGHGYSLYAALPKLVTTQVHVVTAEGDNWVMAQQVARYLLKRAATGDLTLLTDALDIVDDSNLAIAADILRRLCACGQNMVLSLEKQISSDALTRSPLDAWNANAAVMFTLARLTGAAYCLRQFLAHLQVQPKKLHTVLHPIACVYAYSLQDLFASQLLLYGAISPADLISAAACLSAECLKMREVAVILVDAFRLRDDALATPLGSAGGLRYEDLLSLAKSNPLNTHDVIPSARRFAATARAVNGGQQLAARL